MLTNKTHFQAWAYYASAADSSFTKHENAAVFRRVRLRPRVMVDVSQVDASTSVLGLPTRWPFMISPAAMGRLAHPDGEKCLVRAAGQGGIIYGVSAGAKRRSGAKRWAGTVAGR